MLLFAGASPPIATALSFAMVTTVESAHESSGSFANLHNLYYNKILVPASDAWVLPKDKRQTRDKRQETNKKTNGSLSVRVFSILFLKKWTVDEETALFTLQLFFVCTRYAALIIKDNGVFVRL